MDGFFVSAAGVSPGSRTPPAWCLGGAGASEVVRDVNVLVDGVLQQAEVASACRRTPLERRGVAGVRSALGVLCQYYGRGRSSHATAGESEQVLGLLQVIDSAFVSYEFNNSLVGDATHACARGLVVALTVLSVHLQVVLLFLLMHVPLHHPGVFTGFSCFWCRL